MSKYFFRFMIILLLCLVLTGNSLALAQDEGDTETAQEEVVETTEDTSEQSPEDAQVQSDDSNEEESEQQDDGEGENQTESSPPDTATPSQNNTNDVVTVHVEEGSPAPGGHAPGADYVEVYDMKAIILTQSQSHLMDTGIITVTAMW